MQEIHQINKINRPGVRFRDSVQLIFRVVNAHTFGNKFTRPQMFICELEINSKLLNC